MKHGYVSIHVYRNLTPTSCASRAKIVRTERKAASRNLLWRKAFRQPYAGRVMPLMAISFLFALPASSPWTSFLRLPRTWTLRRFWCLPCCIGAP